MARAPWTDAALQELVAGSTISLRTTTSDDVAIPAWLAEAADHVDESGWAQGISRIDALDRAELVHGWWEALRRPGEVVEVSFWELEDGERFRRARLVNLVDDPRIGGVLLAVRDSEPTETELAARAEGQGVRTSADVLPEDFSSPAWIVQYVDPSGTIRHTEGRVEELYGRSADELAGRNALEFLHPDGHAAALAAWLDILADPGGARTIEQRLLLPDRSTVWVESAMLNRLDDPAIGAIMVVGHDITERHAHDLELRASRQELRLLADHDALTGTLTRRALDQRLEDAFGNRNGSGPPDVLVAFIDLDGFKAVNDGHGHETGDLVLHAIGQRLRRVIRPDDEIGRYGGDEFVIVCPDAPPGAEDEVEASIARAFAEPVTWRGGSWAPRASVGMARPEGVESPTDVVRRADQAMYRQKQTRRAV